MDVESFAFLFRTLDLEKREQTEIDENMISEATILRFFGAFYFLKFFNDILKINANSQKLLSAKLSGWIEDPGS